ncbi:MAG: putative tellurite resistance protein B-like protein [Paracoccaceae bacterium]|jgi:uncharacterized tellurite resistance protein B-like protein
MVLSLIKRLTAKTVEPLNPDDARLALSALLVRIARTDGQYDVSEVAEIARVLMERYGLNKTAAEALRTEAEALEKEAPDTVRFTRAIKDAVAYEEREGVVEALWKVVLSDGVRDHHEDGLMRLVVKLLGVNDRDSALARHRVEAMLE